MLEPEHPASCQYVNAAIRTWRSSICYEPVSSQNRVNQLFEPMAAKVRSDMIDYPISSSTLDTDALFGADFYVSSRCLGLASEQCAHSFFCVFSADLKDCQGCAQREFDVLVDSLARKILVDPSYRTSMLGP
jgi:hypothetical protein